MDDTDTDEEVDEIEEETQRPYQLHRQNAIVGNQADAEGRANGFNTY